MKIAFYELRHYEVLLPPLLLLMPSMKLIEAEPTNLREHLNISIERPIGVGLNQ